ncbi:MAG: diaminopimelate decarboxylase [Candidatus Microsaccharimonas sp.]
MIRIVMNEASSHTKTTPFDLDEAKSVISKYPTPFHIYDEVGIRNTAKEFLDAFSWSPGFTNYYALKALPNPQVLKILIVEGMGLDCSSLAELVLAEQVGVIGEKIMFTSNNTSSEEFIKAFKLGAIINLDDISHIDYLEEAVDTLPELLCFRFNPGSQRSGNDIIGNPSEAKFGLTKKQLMEAYKRCQAKGVKRFGLHTMIASNELNEDYFVETAKMLFELAVEIKHQLGIELEFIDLGGGFGIPYLPDQPPLDISEVSEGIHKLYTELLAPNDLEPKLFYECGRFITGPHGYLVSTVRHIKNTYRDYIGLDATMADLMRPGMYEAYHHITVLGKENQPYTSTYDVTGSLCENNDKFAIQRSLPKIAIGDVFVIHDTGAHGHSMGFNYNGKLRSAELLIHPNHEVELIRRAETLDDYFATLKF